MMAAVTVVSMMAALAGEPGAPSPPPAPTKGPQDWYANNICIECHRQRGGRLADIVDREWAKSVHHEKNVPCEQCHGGDATLKRDDFPSDEAFKEASHLTFKPEFLFLRDRNGIGVTQETVISFACRECHREGEKRRVGDPHRGTGIPTCLFFRDRGVNTTRGRSIAYVCAKCHVRAAEKHLGSAHGSFGVPSCLFCHGSGSHAIMPATMDIIDPRPRDELGRCAPCHTPGNMEVVKRIREMREQTAERIRVSQEQFEDLVRMGYRNLALSEMQAHVDDIRRSLREVLHGTDLREIMELTKSIEHIGKQTAYDHELVLALREARRGQTHMALGIAGLLVLLAAMLVAYRRAFCERARRADP